MPTLSATPYIPSGNPNKVNHPVDYAPGALGNIYPHQDQTFQVVRLDPDADAYTPAGEVVDGQLAYWRDKTACIVTNDRRLAMELGVEPDEPDQGLPVPPGGAAKPPEIGGGLPTPPPGSIIKPPPAVPGKAKAAPPKEPSRRRDGKRLKSTVTDAYRNSVAGVFRGPVDAGNITHILRSGFDIPVLTEATFAAGEIVIAGANDKAMVDHVPLGTAPGFVPLGVARGPAEEGKVRVDLNITY